MKALFADTWFWIALANPYDKYHPQVKSIKSRFPDSYVITTDEILVEFLTYFSDRGKYSRIRASQVVQEMLDSDVEILPQSRDSFLKGFDLYKQRPDKGYSLTDCISMQTMKAMSINEALTHDHHFTQEGFKRLLN